MSEWDVVVPGGVRQWFYVFFLYSYIAVFAESFLSINLIKMYDYEKDYVFAGIIANVCIYCMFR